MAPASRVRRTTNPEPPGDGTFAGAGDVGALSDWGLPVGRAVDVGPRALRDRGDRGSDAFGGASDGRRQAMVWRTFSRFNAVMVSLDQNPESTCTVNSQDAPPRRTPAMRSSRKRTVPRWVFAEPLRIRA